MRCPFCDIRSTPVFRRRHRLLRIAVRAYDASKEKHRNDTMDIGAWLRGLGLEHRRRPDRRGRGAGARLGFAPSLNSLPNGYKALQQASENQSYSAGNGVRFQKLNRSANGSKAMPIPTSASATPIQSTLTVLPMRRLSKFASNPVRNQEYACTTQLHPVDYRLEQISS